MDLPSLEEYMGSLIAPLLRSGVTPDILQTQDSLGILLIIHVDKTDLAYLIGSQGKTIAALRVMARAYGSRNRLPVSLKILEKRV
ncbi:MAG: KH domain-containing protein [Candidatus Gracilibacteria bacterium]